MKTHTKYEQAKVSPSPSSSKETPDYKSNQQILNNIFPPKQWTDGKGTWVQRASCEPSTKTDVLLLEQLLNKELQIRHARHSGICPIRSELYSQCFDELIRQMAVNCGERGVLLCRVRDESQMTIAAYRTVYESSIAFGMRKALMGKKGKAEMKKRIADLEEENEKLEKQLAEQMAKNEATEAREVERKQEVEKRHIEEIQALKSTKQQLTEQLVELITPNM